MIYFLCNGKISFFLYRSVLKWNIERFLYIIYVFVYDSPTAVLHSLNHVFFPPVCLNFGTWAAQMSFIYLLANREQFHPTEMLYESTWYQFYRVVYPDHLQCWVAVGRCLPPTLMPLLCVSRTDGQTPGWIPPGEGNARKCKVSGRCSWRETLMVVLQLARKAGWFLCGRRGSEVLKCRLRSTVKRRRIGRFPRSEKEKENGFEILGPGIKVGFPSISLFFGESAIELYILWCNAGE